MTKEYLHSLIMKMESTDCKNKDLELFAITVYNKAIDDALDLYYSPSDEDSEQDKFDTELEKLKLKNRNGTISQFT